MAPKSFFKVNKNTEDLVEEIEIPQETSEIDNEEIEQKVKELNFDIGNEYTTEELKKADINLARQQLGLSKVVESIKESKEEVKEEKNLKSAVESFKKSKEKTKTKDFAALLKKGKENAEEQIVTKNNPEPLEIPKVDPGLYNALKDKEEKTERKKEIKDLENKSFEADLNKFEKEEDQLKEIGSEAMAKTLKDIIQKVEEAIDTENANFVQVSDNLPVPEFITTTNKIEDPELLLKNYFNQMGYDLENVDFRTFMKRIHTELTKTEVESLDELIEQHKDENFALRDEKKEMIVIAKAHKIKNETVVYEIITEVPRNGILKNMSFNINLEDEN